MNTKLGLLSVLAVFTLTASAGAETLKPTAPKPIVKPAPNRSAPVVPVQLKCLVDFRHVIITHVLAKTLPQGGRVKLSIVTTYGHHETTFGLRKAPSLNEPLYLKNMVPQQLGPQPGYLGGKLPKPYSAKCTAFYVPAG